MKTIAAIPTLNAIEWVAPLVEHLLLADQVDEIWIYDNGCTDLTADWVRNRRLMDRRLLHIDSRGMGLYAMWNDMIGKASVLDDQVNLALLNSDIRLPHNGIKTLSDAMRSGDFKIATIDPARPAVYSQHLAAWHPPTRDVFGPISEPYPVEVPPTACAAWAVVIAAEFWKDEVYAVFPGFQWWYGDDDLFRRAYERGGRICQVVGIGSDHLGASSDAHNPRKHEMIAQDTALFSKMYGDAKELHL